MAIQTRKEMDAAFQWALSDIFKDGTAWQQAYDKAEAELGELGAISGSLKDAASLRQGLDTYYRIQQDIFLVYIYAMLVKSGDNGDPEAQAMEERAMRLYVTADAESSFLTPEILALPKETLEACKSDPALAGYRHILQDIDRGRPYTLDAEREKMLAMLQSAAQTPDNSFTMLESVDMTFPAVTDAQGNEVTLTHGNFSVFRESPDRWVRQEAYEKYFGEFKRFINTSAAMYAGSVKFDTFFSDVRGYPSACEAALFSSNVPVSVYDSLIEAVHDKLPAMQAYIELRKRVLGIQELHMYDLYCPIVEDVQTTLTYDEAKALVREALRPLGEEYGRLLDRAFDERWIDVYENAGKTTGAFSCGVHGVHPYVLLNFSGQLDDAFTLAHELGHAMHSFFSSEAQDFANHGYRILVAEVASTVNEVLLLKYLLAREQDGARRAYLLNRFLEGFRTTLFRQVLFAEFEREVHDMHQRGEPVIAESLNALYRSLNERYYQGAVVDELQDIEWARIPHFYRAFYVYQYATGYASAVAIAEDILQGKGVPNYLAFLKTGGSDYPLNELRLAGVDLTQPDTVRSALEVFSATVQELAGLL